MTPRPQIPGIVLVVLFCAALLVVADLAIGAVRGRDYSERIHFADSTAKAQTMIAVIAKRDARAADGARATEKRRADSLETVAAAARVDVARRLEQATASRSALTSATLRTLPAEVLAALADGDSLRLAVTPTLAKDSAAIVGYQATIARDSAAIALRDAAIAALEQASAARTDQIRALEAARQRCGRRCGAVLAGVALETLHQLPRILRALFPPSP